MFPPRMPTSSPTIVRVLLAVPHEATAAGVYAALRDGPFDVTTEIADAAAAVAAAERECPDICLLDADMSGDVLGAIAAVARVLPSAGIVVLAADRDEVAMLNAVGAGAVGYLLKDMDPARLRYALLGVTQGEAAIPRTLVKRLITEFRLREHRTRLPVVGGGEAELTPREWEVLSLMADGAATRDMAARLGIADVTVRRHVSAALAKLQVTDRDAAVELLRAALRS
jgi:DNA-binding NarL/FixJ family response regulator